VLLMIGRSRKIERSGIFKHSYFFLRPVTIIIKKKIALQGEMSLGTFCSLVRSAVLTIKSVYRFSMVLSCMNTYLDYLAPKQRTFWLILRTLPARDHKAITPNQWHIITQCRNPAKEAIQIASFVQSPS
jgi:hypothetical protein